MSSGAQAEPKQGAGPPLHVRSARDLFQALESGDGTIRLAALQAVQQAPDTALSFGLCENRDVLDVLLSQAERFRGNRRARFRFRLLGHQFQSTLHQVAQLEVERFKG